MSKGVKVIWGVTSNPGDNPDYTITAANWVTFRQAILDAATWAQANGVYEFQLGNEEESHNDDTTLTDAQLQANLKSVATDVQAIFTRGKISYTTHTQEHIDEWAALGLGDIDLFALNTYRGGTTFDDEWKDKIDSIYSNWGTKAYITEFGLSYVSLNSYSTDEAVQAAGIAEMIDYIKDSGIERAHYFCWNPFPWGVLKTDGDYRQLWDVLTGTDTDTTAPDIAISPASKDFGSIDIGSTTNPGQTFTIQNTGSASLTVGTITITGTDAGQFAKSNDNASGQTIAAGTSKTITVIFDPSAVGAKTASMSISSNDPDSPILTASLTGTGSNTIITDTTTTTPATTAPNTTGQSNNAAPTYSNTSVSVVTNTTLQEKEPVKAFTTRFYKLCLSRDPDSAGLNGWVNGLETGAIKGADVAYGFLFSDEFIKRNVSNEEYITILYRAFFNREPDSGGYSGWLAHLNAGKSRTWVLDRFISSKEFKTLCAAYGINPGSK